MSGVEASAMYITGPVPTELGMLTKMWKKLDFNDQALSGAIPTQLGHLEEMEGKRTHAQPAIYHEARAAIKLSPGSRISSALTLLILIQFNLI